MKRKVINLSRSNRPNKEKSLTHSLPVGQLRVIGLALVVSLDRTPFELNASKAQTPLFAEGNEAVRIASYALPRNSFLLKSA